MRCTACSPTSPIRKFPAPASPPISSNCRRSSTNTGSNSRDVLRRFALHYQTGEPMPEELLQRLIAARNFNQGFATVEYVASAFVDLDFHSLASPAAIDPDRVRSRGARAHRHAGRNRHAPPPAAFRPHLFGRRLCGRLLQLHVVGSARRRRVRGVRGDRRHFRSGDGEAAARHDLRRRRLARSGRGLQSVSRPAAERRCAAAQARLRRPGLPLPWRAACRAMDLHSAGHRRGVVCAPHSAAVEAGRAILAEGGNAIEAMLAMAATIAAVYPHMNHLGGDGFWLIREPNGRVRAIMAAGPAGQLARPELYRDYETIPPRGPLAALTVPGAVGGWMLALEAAQRPTAASCRSMSCSRRQSRTARNGYTVTRSQARLTEEHLAELAPVPGFAATFLVDGKVPAAGATLEAGSARRDAGAPRPCRPRRFLSRRRRARDRGRPRTHRQPGHARGSDALSRHARRTAARRLCRPARSTTPTRRPRASSR